MCTNGNLSLKYKNSPSAFSREFEHRLDNEETFSLWRNLQENLYLVCLSHRAALVVVVWIWASLPKIVTIAALHSQSLPTNGSHCHALKVIDCQARVETRVRESGPAEAKPSTRTTGLPPNEVGPRCDSTDCALCCRNSTSWMSGFPVRLGGEPLKYGGEQPKLEISPQPPLLRKISSKSKPASPSGLTVAWLLRRLEGLRYSLTGQEIVVGRRGFGQITSSSLFPSTRYPVSEGRRPSFISGRLLLSREFQAPANCWTPPIFLAISSFATLRPLQLEWKWFVQQKMYKIVV